MSWEGIFWRLVWGWEGLVDLLGVELSGFRLERGFLGAIRVGVFLRLLSLLLLFLFRFICLGVLLVLFIFRFFRSVIDSCRLIFFIRFMAI